MRRILIFIVVDAPLSMTGEPISQFQKLIKKFVNSLKNDPTAIEIGYLTVISSNSINSDIVLPLTPIADLENFTITINCAGKSNIFNGLDTYVKLFRDNYRKSTMDEKGDFGILFYLLVGTIPQTDFPISYFENFKRCINNATINNLFGNSLDCLLPSSELISNNQVKKDSNAHIIYYQNQYVGTYYHKYFENVYELSTILTNYN
jgi:uncharacterized protein YegL